MIRPTIYLFDIDGTLLDGKGAGRQAMEQAFAAVTGDREALGRMRFAGMTDRAIVRRGLELAAVEPSDAIIDAVLEGYLDRLAAAIEGTHGYGLHLGVHEVLDRVAEASKVAVGLGTGNVRRGAALKLTPVGVYQRFAFGGFGCDHEDRTELLRIGAQRGAGTLGHPVEDCRLVVIGDTPRDVEAALALGAECLAVGTSFYGVDELRQGGATLAVADLTVPEALRMLLGS